MNPYDTNLSVSALANAIARQLTPRELEFITLIFDQFTHTLRDIAIARAFCDSNPDTFLNEDDAILLTDSD